MHLAAEATNAAAEAANAAADTADTADAAAREVQMSDNRGRRTGLVYAEIGVGQIAA